jgi:DNA polymerase-1
MEKMAKILLLDGPAIAYRSHFALARANLTTPDGREVAATHGYTTTLLKLLREEAPDYACVAFDTEEPTYRHDLFEEYKADRPGMPEELAGQMEWIEGVSEGLGVKVLAIDGYEADDVIATLADQARARGIEAVIVTGDKDMLQLVDAGTKVIMLSGWGRDTKVMDAKAVRDKYGIPPDRLPDYFALMGDAIDNIRGVPGIGPKTAGSLVREYGHLEDIYAALETIRPGKVRKILEENRDTAFESRKLVTVHREVPLPVGIDGLQVGKPGGEGFRELLKTLGFGRLARQVFGEAQRPTATPEVWQAGEDPVSCKARAGLDANLSGGSAVTSDILGVAVSCEDGGDYYLPLGHREPGNIDRETFHKALGGLLSDGKVEKVAHDAKRVMIALERLGLGMQRMDFDTSLAAYLVNPGRGVRVEDIAADYLGEFVDRGGKRKGTDQTATIRQASEMCCLAGRVALGARPLLEEDLRSKGLERLYRELEMPLIEVLADMEMRGIRIDRGLLKDLSDELDKRMATAEKEAFVLAGRSFNLNSTKDVAAILFDEIGLKPRRKTKTGFSTDTVVLTELAAEHDLPGKILDYRQTAKLKSSHVDQLLSFADPEVGRIHACFHQTVTATGRLSSSDPNLQNVPIRGELGTEIRRAFIPSRPDWVLISADYSQIELRVVADLSGDPALLEAFRSDRDIHASTAAFIFKVAPEAVSPAMRTVAKAVNFGIIYGMGPQALAKSTGLSMEEAAGFVREHRETYPGLYEYIESTLKGARETGCVETVLGRKRFIPGIGSTDSAARSAAERMAVNTPVQGSAADIIKLAMLEIFAESRTRGLKGGIVIQVHDEILVDCPEDEREVFTHLVRDKMSNAYKMSVPLKVEVGHGKNWHEAHR